jgi:cytochrome P450
MRTINDMLGVPESERAYAARAGDAIVGRADPEFGDLSDPIGGVINARNHLYALGAELARQRRAKPEDDIITNLVQAEVDGHRLTDDDIGAFMVLFTVAGNDTTRNTTALSTVAFDRNRGQRDFLMDDFDARILPAIEEFVRYGSPVMQFARTALIDTELGGQQISAGDKVCIFYCSGNRDETVFDRPNAFDISREKNQHVGFGGGGPHFCVGAGLARSQLRAITYELMTQVPHMEVGEPVFAPGNFIRVVSELPVRV